MRTGEAILIPGVIQISGAVEPTALHTVGNFFRLMIRNIRGRLKVDQSNLTFVFGGGGRASDQAVASFVESELILVSLHTKAMDTYRQNSD